MATAVKLAGSPIELPGRLESLATRAVIRRAAAMLAFLVLVLCGSGWAVYTMQYYDTLDGDAGAVHRLSSVSTGASSGKLHPQTCAQTRTRNRGS